GEDPLRLFDADPALQRVLQLLREQPLPRGGAVLQDADGGDIGQCLRLDQPGVVERMRVRAQQVQRTDHLLRNLIGNAYTDAYPADRASCTNVGQRTTAAARSSHRTASPLR